MRGAARAIPLPARVRPNAASALLPISFALAFALGAIVAPPDAVQGLVDKLHTQKGILITQKTLPGANHFFSGMEETLLGECADYLDARLRGELVPDNVRKLAGR